MTTATSSDPAGEGIRAVVWDLDGTLIDTECIFADAARRLLARRGLVLENEFMATMRGTPGREALPRFRERYGLTLSIEDLAAEYKQSFFEVIEGQLARLMPGVLDLLNWLESRTIPNAIATSSSREYVASVFAPLQMLPRFEFVLTIDDVTHGKPNPEVYMLAAVRLGVAPRQLAVIEDSVAGYRAAVAAGARCIVVGHECDRADAFEEAVLVVPDLHAPQLTDLLHRLIHVSR